MKILQRDSVMKLVDPVIHNPLQRFTNATTSRVNKHARLGMGMKYS
jgi:hypothetical protein